MGSKKHSKLTGDKTKISRKVGSKFMAFGNYIKGKNLELIKDKKIVQDWSASDWPKGHASIITFLLKPVKGGAKHIFSHKYIPVDQVKDIPSGWKTYYWEPLKKMLKK